MGIESSGFHSNGYSLLRKIFSEKELRGKMGKRLLAPTRIYVKPVLRLLAALPLHGIVHITGGGFIDNLPRVIPAGLSAQIEQKSWPRPSLFQRVQESGNITDFEMTRTFNMGIGMVLMLRRKYQSDCQKILSKQKIASWVIGKITQGQRPVELKP